MTDFKRTTELDLLGVKYNLTARFSALREIEARSGLMLSEINQKMVNGSIGVELIAAIIYGGMVGAAGKDKPVLTYEETCDAVVDHGINDLSVDIIRFLLLCVKRNPTLDAEPDVDAPAKTPEKKV